jgi:hypothetical protein
VPVTLATDSPRVLEASGIKLTPHAVGTTTLTLGAGGKQKKLPVRVVRTLTPEALPLEAGHRIYFSLPEGKFEIQVTLPVDKTINIEWRGAPYCSYKGTGKLQRSSCVLQAKGGIVVDNPAYVTSGDTQVSANGILISEVP